MSAQIERLQRNLKGLKESVPKIKTAKLNSIIQKQITDTEQKLKALISQQPEPEQTQMPPIQSANAVQMEPSNTPTLPQLAIPSQLNFNNIALLLGGVVVLGIVFSTRRKKKRG